MRNTEVGMRNWGIILILFLPSLGMAQSTAAEAYRIAASQIPVATNDAERFILKSVIDAPLNDSARELLKRGASQLALFDASSAMAFGDWGLDETDPTYGGRSIKGLAELADLVILRARSNAANGDLDGALADCYRVALLASRLSAQPSLTRQIQQNDVMARSLEMAATLLPRLSPPQIERFNASLKELRPPVDPITISQLEQESYLGLYTRLINDEGMRRMASRAGGTLNAVFGIQTQPIDVEDLARDPLKAQDVLNETREIFAKMIDVLKEPPGERAAAMKIIPRQHDFTHPLSRGAAELVTAAYRLGEEQSRLMEVYQIAAAICDNPARPIDPEWAKSQAGKSRYVPVPGGFELHWKATDDEIERVLRVGERPTRTPPTTASS